MNATKYTLAHLANALDGFNRSIDRQHHARQWFNETLLMTAVDILMDAHRKGETTNAEVESVKGWVYIAIVMPITIHGGGNLWWEEVRDALASV